MIVCKLKLIVHKKVFFLDLFLPICIQSIIQSRPFYFLNDI